MLQQDREGRKRCAGVVALCCGRDENADGDRQDMVSGQRSQSEGLGEGEHVDAWEAGNSFQVY